MHKVRIMGVRTLETPRFDGESGLMMNPCKGTVKWDEKVPITEAGIYNNMEVVILTKDEYAAITGDKEILIPASFIAGLKTLMTMTLDLIASAEKGE